jgi:hypothetical protein
MGRSAVLTKAKDVGEQVAPRARELRDAIGPVLKDVRDAAGPKARELRDAAGPKARELRDAAAPKVKEVRRSVGYWIAGEEPEPPKASKWPAVIGTGVGALAVFFFDPVSGKRRRAATKEWLATKVRSLTGRERPRSDATAPLSGGTFAPTA